MPVFIHAFMKRYSAALAQKKKYDRLSFVRNDYHELQMLFLSPENRKCGGLAPHCFCSKSPYFSLSVPACLFIHPAVRYQLLINKAEETALKIIGRVKKREFFHASFYLWM